MTIKQKIRSSNILMVFIPIIVTALTLVICMHTSLGSYLYSLETMYKDENGIQSAQSLIYTYQQELWENNWGEQGTKVQGEPIRQSEAMYHMEKKLSKMGYHILVKKSGHLLYSNFSDGDMDSAEMAAGGALHSAKNMTAGSENVSVIKNTFYHDENEFSIIAVNSGQGEQQVVSYFQSYIMRYVLIFLILFFSVTILVNVGLSYWVSKSVLTPLKKLSLGTKEIKEGNLDTMLNYHKKDEFGEVCQDFEDMRRYLKQSVEERLEYENRRKEMISGISHDLRTPLTSIGGYLDGLIDGIADTPEKRKRYLNAIKTRAKDLERLVDSLSEYNRLENGRLKYHLEYGDLKCFFEQYLALYREEAKNNGVKVLFAAKEKRYPAYFDEYEMNRVFDNLFTNTIRYREGSKSIVEIRLKRSADQSWIEITFTDDGPGVPAESFERIFETFYRVDDARSQAGKGSGIGLAVVKEIITGHGGTVYAENCGGLSIIINLPVTKE
ncbi:ATP-binding protein [Lacrimispora sp.]|uniref:sensor histidine kinase n=1 Tax=Lacrimispora sp. TaxID=2719234 RepID=UPI00345FF8DC